MPTKLEKNLYKLAIPIFIELLFMMLLGTVDTIMLSRFDDNAVGAVSNANTVINFLTVLINVVSVGIGVVISNYLGARNEDFAKRAISTGVFFNTILGLSLFLFFQFFGDSLFKLVGTSEIFLLNSTNYLKIVTMGIPFIALSQVLSASLRSYGKPRQMMIVTMISNIINVIINFILIFDVFHTNNPVITGVNGAAIGTLASYLFTFVLSIILVKKIIKAKIINLNLDKECLKQILRIGLPSALENVSYNISQFIILWVVNQMKDENIVNARAYILTITSFVYLFSNSFANSNQIIIGYDIGEKDYDAAYKQTYKSFLHGLVYVLVMVSIINIFGRDVLGILTKNEDIINIALKALPIIIILEIGRTSNLVFIQALKACGDTIFPLVIGIASMLGIAALGSYIFGLCLSLGIVGIFIAAAADECMRGILVVFRWKSKAWTKKSIIKD